MKYIILRKSDISDMVIVNRHMEFGKYPVPHFFYEFFIGDKKIRFTPKKIKVPENTPSSSYNKNCIQYKIPLKDIYPNKIHYNTIWDNPSSCFPKKHKDMLTSFVENVISIEWHNLFQKNYGGIIAIFTKKKYFFIKL